MIFLKNIFFDFKKRALIFIALFVLFNTSLLSSVLPDVKSKSIWIPEEYLLDTNKVDSVIDFVKVNNIDKIFFKVQSNGNAMYKSEILPNYENIDFSNDPLEYVLKGIKNIDVELHAWINAYLLLSGGSYPEGYNHIYYSCPNCLESDINGKSDKDIKLDYIQSKDWEGIFLSPIHPDVNNYILEIVDELVEKYDIDGVHLDYVRYQDNFYGYNNDGINEFINLHGIDPRDINRGIISERFGYEEEFIDSIIYKWDKFRMNKITELIRSIKYSFITDSLNLKLSAAVKPNYFDAKFRWFQDWVSWIEEDIIDFVVIKNFTSNLSKFNVQNKMINSKLSNFNQKNKVYIGLNAIENLDLINNQILISRLQGYENFTIFEYNIKMDSLNSYNHIINTLNFKLH